MLLALQQIDQVNRAVEAHALAVQSDAGHGQNGGQVRLLVPGPPMSTTFCAVSVKVRLASSLISRASVLKLKPVRSRCMGSLAMLI